MNNDAQDFASGTLPALPFSFLAEEIVKSTTGLLTKRSLSDAKYSTEICFLLFLLLVAD